MTSTTFFIILIPILAVILLLVNLLLAPHNPYQEKNSPFECGFHSFLDQNRREFNISFYIFGLAFLLFDIEVVMIYPMSVSGYIGDIYSISIMLVFFIVLTIGLAYELGKNALSIDSRQTSVSNNTNTHKMELFVPKIDVPKTGIFENSVSAVEKNPVSFEEENLVSPEEANPVPSAGTSEETPVTMFTCLGLNTDQERFVPLVWDNETFRFVRDKNIEIRYWGPKCVIDETRDNKLAEKKVIEDLKSKNVCVCNG